jgi:hypothetical protein
MFDALNLDESTFGSVYKDAEILEALELDVPSFRHIYKDTMNRGLIHP